MSMKGRALSPEHRAKLSAAKKTHDEAKRLAKARAEGAQEALSSSNGQDTEAAHQLHLAMFGIGTLRRLAGRDYIPLDIANLILDEADEMYIKDVLPIYRQAELAKKVQKNG